MKPTPDPEVLETKVGDDDDGVIAQRTIAFPPNENNREERHIGQSRPKGPEMKRTLTQEERDLANAGYGELDASKQNNRTSEPTNVDIQEHRLPLSALEEALDTSFDYKDASQSQGLTEEEAKVRLQRDGRNVLTPPKKKSALRKVCKFLCDEFVPMRFN